MTESQSELTWRQELLQGKPLDLEPGETVRFKFHSEGEHWEPKHPGPTPATLFHVQPEVLYGTQVTQRLFVRAKDLKEQIAALGDRIIEVEVELQREGKGLDTRWTLTLVEGPE